MKKIGRALHNNLLYKEMVEQGNDCIRLHETYGISLSNIAKRKGVSINSIRNWISKARPVFSK